MPTRRSRLMLLLTFGAVYFSACGPAIDTTCPLAISPESSVITLAETQQFSAKCENQTVVYFVEGAGEGAVISQAGLFEPKVAGEYRVGVRAGNKADYATVSVTHTLAGANWVGSWEFSMPNTSQSEACRAAPEAVDTWESWRPRKPEDDSQYTIALGFMDGQPILNLYHVGGSYAFESAQSDGIQIYPYCEWSGQRPDVLVGPVDLKVTIEGEKATFPVLGMEWSGTFNTTGTELTGTIRSVEASPLIYMLPSTSGSGTFTLSRESVRPGDRSQ